MERSLPSSAQALSYMVATSLISLPVMILIYRWATAG